VSAPREQKALACRWPTSQQSGLLDQTNKKRGRVWRAQPWSSLNVGEHIYKKPAVSSRCTCNWPQSIDDENHRTARFLSPVSLGGNRGRFARRAVALLLFHLFTSSSGGGGNSRHPRNQLTLSTCFNPMDPSEGLFLYKKTGSWPASCLSTICQLEQAFFLEAANSGGADFYFDFFSVNHQSFGLQIRLPHPLGMALRKADVVAVLFSLLINF
jgi:hypothetical protein